MRLTIALILATALACSAADWPHWRGPARDGTTTESSRFSEGAWPPGDPVWTAQVGDGGSSPIVAEGRVYTIGWRDGAECVECRDLPSGEVLWSRSYEAPRYARYHVGDEGQYSGPSATPEYDPETGLLFTLGIDGDLTCWDAARDGERVWGLNLYDDFGAKQRPDVGGGLRDYGYTCAPMVVGDAVLVEAGSPQGSIIALHRRTGERLWASKATEEAGHTGGMARMTVEGVPCVAVLTLRGLLVVRVDAGHEGETLARFPWETSFANTIAAPAVFGDSVIITSGYSQSRTARVRVTPDGADLVWETRNVFSKVCTPVIHGGRVYFAWHKLRALDWETGKVLWEGGRFGDDASLILTADERLVVFGARTLALCETGDAFAQLASQDDAGAARCWPHVALADGRALCRDRDGNLACFLLDR